MMLPPPMQQKNVRPAKRKKGKEKKREGIKKRMITTMPDPADLMIGMNECKRESELTEASGNRHGHATIPVIVNVL
jgi:hypothetical protein